ncbi:ATP-binding cassette domain-containing protein [Rothia uropygialis]|uniref:hypothetical protein n=1 Tax=Kocuria sp. 36 TaxID=1415402 RepID=UPI00101D62F4|nr:hypothetical protein [Kocuria sp. 36]
MKKKLQLVSALLLRRKLTVIDETLNGLDLEALARSEADLFSLAKNGSSLLLCSHDLGLLERIADRIVFMIQGNVVVSESKTTLVQDYGTLGRMVEELLTEVKPR